MLITTVLNLYRRPHVLVEQIEAIRKQTVPSKILIWQNRGAPFDSQIKTTLLQDPNITWMESSENFGVWARFAAALNARTPYVCVFDDDTIPGRRWYENCLETMKTHEGLLGTIGLLFKDNNPGSYKCGGYIRYGWDGNQTLPIQVDVVGHAWFFRREWLSAFWREQPSEDQCMVVGEDVHFSHMLQKYCGIKTFVPPHPPNQVERWGSVKGYAYGVDSVCVSGSPSGSQIPVCYAKYVERGFKTINS